jgi:hypothetical protein
MRSICEHSGLVGETISWTIVARAKEGDAVIDEVSGTQTLAIRNNALYVPENDADNCTP